MLQQTQVKTVIPYFNNFVKTIPTLKALSKTKEKTVLKLWEGLGYYRRAKNLYKTSKILIKSYKNKLPNKYEEIKKLPGIGDYTANVLLALVYNQPRIGIDGNVKRVYFRLFNKSIDNKKEAHNKNLIERTFLNSRNADIAEALMEFGAVICKPKNPNCSVCNLKNNCFFFKKGNFNLEKKIFAKEKKYNIYCYLKKRKKQIALTKNKSLSFLNNFNMPKTEIVSSLKNKEKKGWVYLCNYKNSISNIKMDINLFYKFTKEKPQNFKWYSIEHPLNEFIPSFTKNIFKKINKAYL